LHDLIDANDQLGSEAMRKMKNHLRSWRHSAHNAANARRTKVIYGRIYDARRISIFARRAIIFAQHFFCNTYVAEKRYIDAPTNTHVTDGISFCRDKLLRA
jgi:hypothetical protein